MDLSIIIVGYKCCHDIENALISVERHFIGFTYETILVNNFAGDDELPALMNKHPELILIDEGTNPGFGVANNYGLTIAKGKYICFLNPDIIILNNILPLIRMMESDRNTGLISPLLRNTDMSIQRSCYNLPSIKNWFIRCFSIDSFLMKGFSYKGDAEVDWVLGAYMLTGRALMEELGGFDPAFFMYSEDVDLCWRIHKAGYKVMFSDKSEAIHIGGVTSASKSLSKARMEMASRIILWNKHFSKIDVQTLLRITFWSSKLKAFCWTLLCGVKLSGKAGEKDYHRLIAELSREQIKSSKQ